MAAALTTVASTSGLSDDDLQLRNMKTVFDLFDTRGRGEINAEDLPVILKSLGISKEYLSEEVYDSIRGAIDPRRTGVVSFETYVRVIRPCMPRPGGFDEQFRVYRMLDREKKGYISLEDLIAVGVVECTGMLTEAQCAHVVRQLRTSSRPGITFDDFKRAVNNATQLELGF